MASMTLQRAQQVFNRIKTETAFGGEEEDAYTSYGRRRRPTANQRNNLVLRVNLSVDHPVVQQAEAYQRHVKGKITKIFDLLDISTKIRSRIAVKQSECGVTPLVTRRVAINQKIRVLEHVLAQIETDTLNVGLLETQTAAIKSRLSSPNAHETVAQISTSVLTAEDRDAFTEQLNQFRSELMSIDDQLGRLNATNEITIDDTELQILRASGLAA